MFTNISDCLNMIGCYKGNIYIIETYDRKDNKNHRLVKIPFEQVGFPIDSVLRFSHFIYVCFVVQ